MKTMNKDFIIDNNKKCFSKVKALLISKTIIDLLIIAILILFLCAFFLMPFPERLNPSDLDEIMIKRGQLATLYILYISIFLMLFLYILHIIISIIFNYYLFFCISFTKDDLKTIGKLLIIVYSFFDILIPIILLVFDWLFYFKKIDFNKIKIAKKKTKILINTYLCLVPFSLAAILAPIFTMKKNISINEKAVNANLIYSKNKNNIIVFYFDRAYNHVWNSLLYIDYKINKKNSFIEKFPEFTSFYNVNVNSLPTSFSNLPLLGGMWYSNLLMGTNYINPITNSFYNTYTQGTYLKEVIFNLLNNAIKYDFKNFNIMDLAYYGKNFSGLCGDYQLLNKDLQNECPTAFSTSSSAILKKYGYEYNGESSDSARYFNMITQKNDNEKLKYIKFENTESSIFKLIYSQNTHGPYSYYKNNHLKVTDDRFKNFVKSMWFSIQSLKTILTYFKQEKSENGLSVYDNTMIVVISDHGTNLAKNDNNHYLEFLSNFVDYEKYASNQKMFDYFVNSGGLSPLFMVKPFLKNVENKLTNLKKENLNYLQNFFNTSYNIALSDFPLVLESEMFKLRYQSINKTSFYKPDIDKKTYSNEIIKYIINNIYIDPLNSLAHVTNRNFKILLAEDWRWKNDSNIFKPWAYNLLSYKNNNNIYDAEITLVEQH